MIDKLSSSFGIGSSLLSGGKSQTNAAGARPEAGDSRGAIDKVSLTEQASRLQALEKAIGSLPGVDEGRVSAARAAIAQDRYGFDANAVAGKLVDFERALYGE